MKTLIGFLLGSAALLFFMSGCITADRGWPAAQTGEQGTISGTDRASAQA